MEKPVCLIENTSAGELQVRQEALDILSSIRQPVVVVSIVGLYRTGKSYLMNRLAGKQKGFSLGSTIQSEMKGIWMWCVPHPCRADQTLVLLDTGDLPNDTWIFALALLLSSTVVYNSMRTIDHQALRSLHYITELTNHIKLKADGRSSSNSTEFLPSLIWTLRDFTPDLHFEESSITADEYLERSLNLLTENSSQMALCDNMRGSIETFFPTRKCFLLDQPAPQNEQEILDHLCDADLDPNLVQQVTDFCSYIFEHSKEKTIYGGAMVTGRVLGNLAEKYVDAIRCGSFPCLEKVVQELTDLKNLAALEESVALYMRLLGERADLNPRTGGKDEDELSAIHEACLQEALHTFKTNSFKDEEERYQRDLTERITEMFDGKCGENAEISRCHSLMQRLSGKLNLSSYMRPGGYADYKLQLDSISQAYRDALGEGVQAEKVLEAFRQDQEENLREIRMTDKVLSLQAGHLKEDEAKAECRRQQEEILAAQRAVERRLAEQKALLEEGHQQKAEELNKVIEQLREEIAALRNKCRQEEQDKIRQRTDYDQEMRRAAQEWAKEHQRALEKKIKELEKAKEKREKELLKETEKALEVQRQAHKKEMERKLKEQREQIYRDLREKEKNKSFWEKLFS
ncbi:hypothetical protein GJAV_G00067880 [Gymnothorax javanicus]|nr:hypothetical protein GJAV_G00067880 [Gymnothorax javanicus]